MCADEFAEERRRAEVFDALSHPTRIMILKALNENPAGFADLKKQLGIESSGHLQHHISKLNSLVKTDENGKYVLSDEGKDALNSVETVEKVTESGAKRRVVTMKASNVLKLASLALVALLVASCVVAVFEHNTISVLRNELDSRDTKISELTSQVDALNATVSQQSENVLQLTTELNLAKSVMEIKQPTESCYLTTAEQSQGNVTKIFLDSTDVWLNYNNAIALPFYHVLFGTPDNGTQLYNTTICITLFSVFNGYSYIAYSGDESILIIGVTVRNDYTLEDARNLTDQNSPTNISSSLIKLTAKLYDRTGNVIEATEATFNGQQPLNMGSQEFALKSGETSQAVFYLEPSSWDIDHYEIFVEHVVDSPQSN